MNFRKYKAKKWVRKIIKKNMKMSLHIDCSQYIHSADRITLATLKAIPLFDKTCSKILSVLNEPQRRIFDMSSKIRITQKQVPRVYFMLESICKKIGIGMPNLYLELNRFPNAYVSGTEEFSLTITSGLLECFEDDEIYAVLAHECGHIACEHMLYHTMGDFILGGASMGIQKLENLLSNSLVGCAITSAVETSLELAFFQWQKCSELSADRIAIICCEDANPVIETMMRLAGGTTHIDFEIDRELFISQVEDYNELITENSISKILEFWLTRKQTHPLLAVRAYEAKKFAQSEEFKNLIDSIKLSRRKVLA